MDIMHHAYTSRPICDDNFTVCHAPCWLHLQDQSPQACMYFPGVIELGLRQVESAHPQFGHPTEKCSRCPPSIDTYLVMDGISDIGMSQLLASVPEMLNVLPQPHAKAPYICSREYLPHGRSSSVAATPPICQCSACSWQEARVHKLQYL